MLRIPVFTIVVKGNRLLIFLCQTSLCEEKHVKKVDGETKPALEDPAKIIVQPLCWHNKNKKKTHLTKFLPKLD